MKFALIALLAVSAFSQQQTPVTVRVNAARQMDALPPIYAYFGYDEPNYTYTANGTKLIGELASLSRTPVYIRTHFLLATGDGTPGLKWGSTNAYTEDASGKPVYDWTIVDRILNTYLAAGAKPFVEIGFMPKALSSKPEPYRPTWAPGAKNDQYSIGWSYPPSDYEKWGALVNEWVKHEVAQHGKEEVASWYWEVWNEPDISYWHGTPEEYDKLYDYAANGVKRALPTARIGGPATTGPASAKAAAFLTQFLEHCSTGVNFATGQKGSPLDFITFHAKGRPENLDTHIRMGIAKEVQDIQRGFEIVRSFPSLKDLPIVLSEADPEGCAACSSRVYPQNAYRNGTLYPAYTALMLKNIYDLAAQTKATIAGMLTWAFEFEDQPYFDGFRTLATNGIDKPVLNVFRMAGLMEGRRLEAVSNGSLSLAAIAKGGVRGGQTDIGALAARQGNTVTTLVWHYQDDDTAGNPAEVQLEISGLPSNLPRVLMEQYRIDDSHSNAYSLWKKMGSPAHPTATQYRELLESGGLQLMDSPVWIQAVNGVAKVSLDLPLQSVALVRASW